MHDSSEVEVRNPGRGLNYGQERECREKEEETEEENQGEQFGDNVNQGFRFSHEFKSKVVPEPKCPHCSVVGVDHIVSRKGGTGSSRGKQFILSPFNIIFCRQCGHVYGVAGTSS